MLLILWNCESDFFDSQNQADEAVTSTEVLFTSVKRNFTHTHDF